MSCARVRLREPRLKAATAGPPPDVDLRRPRGVAHGGLTRPRSRRAGRRWARPAGRRAGSRPPGARAASRRRRRRAEWTPRGSESDAAAPGAGGLGGALPRLRRARGERDEQQQPGCGSQGRHEPRSPALRRTEPCCVVRACLHSVFDCSMGRGVPRQGGVPACPTPWTAPPTSLRARDGTRLARFVCRPREETRATVAVVHGYGEHGGATGGSPAELAERGSARACTTCAATAGRPDAAAT